jgi:hypothetical protein
MRMVYVPPVEKYEKVLSFFWKKNKLLFLFQPYSENPAQFKPLTDEE